MQSISDLVLRYSLRQKGYRGRYRGREGGTEGGTEGGREGRKSTHIHYQINGCLHMVHCNVRTTHIHVHFHEHTGTHYGTCTCMLQPQLITCDKYCLEYWPNVY